MAVRSYCKFLFSSLTECRCRWGSVYGGGSRGTLQELYAHEAAHIMRSQENEKHLQDIIDGQATTLVRERDLLLTRLAEYEDPAITQAALKSIPVSDNTFDYSNENPLMNLPQFVGAFDLASYHV